MPMKPGQKARLLIVDDNAVIRRALRGILRQDDSLIVIGEAAGGQAALESIKMLTPDLVCLDVLMPGVDGVAVLQGIREAHPATRVVMISGHSTPDVIQDVRKLGVDGFVVKPFSAARVLEAIHAALVRERAPAPEPVLKPEQSTEPEPDFKVEPTPEPESEFKVEPTPQPPAGDASGA